MGSDGPTDQARDRAFDCKSLITLEFDSCSSHNSQYDKLMVQCDLFAITRRFGGWGARLAMLGPRIEFPPNKKICIISDMRMTERAGYQRFHGLKYRAKKLGGRVEFTLGEFCDWFDAHAGDVCGCGAPAAEVDHVLPVARGGRHTLTNLQKLCRLCNTKKWRWLDGEERMWPWQIPGAKKANGPRKKPSKPLQVMEAPRLAIPLQNGGPITFGGIRLRAIGGGRYEYDLPDIL